MHLHLLRDREIGWREERLFVLASMTCTELNFYIPVCNNASKIWLISRKLTILCIIL